MKTKKNTVCLSFDFDTITGFVSRNQTTPSYISRGEFGIVGAERLLKLLSKYNIKSTWFIPGLTIKNYPTICNKIVNSGHEIGHHSWSHIQPSKQSLSEEENDLIKANEIIYDLQGYRAKGFRSPSWDFSKNTIDLLLKHNFLYDSSLMGHDYKFYKVRNGDKISKTQPIIFGHETNLIEVPISWSLDDSPHFEYHRREGYVQNALKSTKGVLENWLDDYRYMIKEFENGVITYTCHPYIIGRGHRMLMFEKLIETLLKEGATFQTISISVDEYLNQ